jgi:hypothetical protein
MLPTAHTNVVSKYDGLNNELEGVWNLRFCPGIYLEVLKETTKKLKQDIKSPG